MPSLGYLYELFWLMPCCLSVSQITGTNLLRAFSQLYNTCSMFLLWSRTVKFVLQQLQAFLLAFLCMTFVICWESQALWVP